jgi:thiamine-phosphate pyrophosphorylase
MLRILDANLNRLSEGLRLIEDIVRFILNDQDLSEQLKNLRHELQPRDIQLREKLLGARQAENDVGAALEIESEGKRPDAASLVIANSRRVLQVWSSLTRAGLKNLCGYLKR